jgi:mannose-6-phosphate isomerase class I
MNSIPFHTIDWNSISASEHSGASGVAKWRTLQYNGFRIRIVEYSMGYKANHWCKAGHIVYCLEGQITIELSDGRTFSLTKGMSYFVSDNEGTHKSHSNEGVKLLILDGSFLNNKRKENVLNPWKI